MNTISTRVLSALLLSTLLSALQMGCSDSSQPEPASAQSEPAADTSYLDDLAAKQGIELEEESTDPEPEEQVTEIVNSSSGNDPVADEDEEREWVAEEGSKSFLGRSRDRALDIRDQMQGSTTAGQGLAYTLSDEEYAASSGLRWEMPEDWAMAVPIRGRFAEMYITNRLGNASVSFTKETEPVHSLVRRMQAQIIDPMGGRSSAQTSDKTIAGYSVKIVDLEGTYLDPGSKGGTKEQIFYAMHAAIFDLGDSRILIKMWGPQDTVEQSQQLFDIMVNETTKQ